jgi:hypothetical protein
MVFIHGWHHDGGWDDNHFEGFRQALLGLACRESEGAWRQVVGVYVGWHGRTSRHFCYSLYKLLTFWNRYEVARRIGQSANFRRLINTLVDATKAPLDGAALQQNSQLIMMGHSMGAYIFETAFLSLLNDPGTSLLRRYNPGKNTVTTVTQDGQPVTFPDLIILLNSAAKSTVATDIFKHFDEKRLRKYVRYGTNGKKPTTYESPLLISATSEFDYTTKWLFWLGTFGYNTDGHDPSLTTHRLTRDSRLVLCLNRKTPMDYGQCWHCLRSPDVRDGRLQRVSIDLPMKKNLRSVWHARYRLEPVETTGAKGPFWIFQVPADIIKNHNDIYGNPRSNLMVMALAQATGMTLSIASCWDDVFEPNEKLSNVLYALSQAIGSLQQALYEDGKPKKTLPHELRLLASKWLDRMTKWKKVVDKLDYKIVSGQIKKPERDRNPDWDAPDSRVFDILKGTAEFNDDVRRIVPTKSAAAHDLLRTIREQALYLHELCDGRCQKANGEKAKRKKKVPGYFSADA